MRGIIYQVKGFVFTQNISIQNQWQCRTHRTSTESGAWLLRFIFNEFLASDGLVFFLADLFWDSTYHAWLQNCVYSYQWFDWTWSILMANFCCSVWVERSDSLVLEEKLRVCSALVTSMRGLYLSMALLLRGWRWRRYLHTACNRDLYTTAWLRFPREAVREEGTSPPLNPLIPSICSLKYKFDS